MTVANLWCARTLSPMDATVGSFGEPSSVPRHDMSIIIMRFFLGGDVEVAKTLSTHAPSTGRVRAWPSVK